MHWREFLEQPVNVVIAFLFVLSFGLFATSQILQRAQMDDPITGFGEYIGGVILDRLFGPTPHA